MDNLDGLNLNKTVGATLVGVFLAIYLTACDNDQGITYLQGTLDLVGWQLMVGFLCLLSTAHTAILCFEQYEYLVANFGNFAHLSTSEWGYVAHLAIFVFVSLVVQLFYAAKVSSLFPGKRKVVLVTAIVLTALAQTAFGALSTYSTFKLSSTQSMFQISLRSQLGWQLLSSLLASVICDTLISGAMIVDMRHARFTVRSESILQVLSRLVIETNLLTTCCAFLNLILFALYHNSGISTAFSIVTPKLYLFSMLVSINRHHGASLQGISSKGLKHQSSLSDFCRGRPNFPKFRKVARSKIGLPIPFPSAQDGEPDSSSSSWLRRKSNIKKTFTSDLQSLINAHSGTHSGTLSSRSGGLRPPERVTKEDDSRSISDYGGIYGGMTTAVNLSPKPGYSESMFSKQQQPVFDGTGLQWDRNGQEPARGEKSIWVSDWSENDHSVKTPVKEPKRYGYM